MIGPRRSRGGGGSRPDGGLVFFLCFWVKGILAEGREGNLSTDGFIVVVEDLHVQLTFVSNVRMIRFE